MIRGPRRRNICGYCDSGVPGFACTCYPLHAESNSLKVDLESNPPKVDLFGFGIDPENPEQCLRCSGTGGDPEDPGDWVPEAGMQDRKSVV